MQETLDDGTGTGGGTGSKFKGKQQQFIFVSENVSQIVMDVREASNPFYFL